MMLVVAAAVFDMVVGLIGTFSSYTSADDFITVSELHDLFASFLLILIGIELLETVRMYLNENVIRVEVVLVVAIISVARHVIDLDNFKSDTHNILGTAGLILALTAGYYFIKRANKISAKNSEHKS